MSGEIWKAYRNGNLTLARRITAALSHFSVHNGGALPAALIVNPDDVTEAVKVVETLGLTLPVIRGGGTLRGEVWLQVAEAEKGAK